MALTAGIVIGLIVISLFSLFLGYFFERREVFYLGVVILLFCGLSLIVEGFQVVTSTVDAGTLTDSGGVVTVSTTTSYVYSSVDTLFTEALGVLLVIIAAGSAITFNGRNKRREAERRESVDFIS
jgi:predicted tellurium resistance membrane protein TerC